MRLLFWAVSVVFTLFVLWRHMGRLCAGIIALGYTMVVFIDEYLGYMREENT